MIKLPVNHIAINANILFPLISYIGKFINRCMLYVLISTLFNGIYIVKLIHGLQAFRYLHITIILFSECYYLLQQLKPISPDKLCGI